MLLKLLSYFFESEKLPSKKWAHFLPAQTKKTTKSPDVTLNPSCTCHWRQSKHRALPWLRCCNTRFQHTWLQMQVLWQNYSTSFGKKPPVINLFFFFFSWTLKNSKCDNTTPTRSQYACVLQDREPASDHAVARQSQIFKQGH